jgi:hypothetical protein
MWRGEGHSDPHRRRVWGEARACEVSSRQTRVGGGRTRKGGVATHVGPGRVTQSDRRLAIQLGLLEIALREKLEVRRLPRRLPCREAGAHGVSSWHGDIVVSALGRASAASLMRNSASRCAGDFIWSASFFASAADAARSFGSTAGSIMPPEAYHI